MTGEDTRTEWTRLDSIRLPRKNAKLHDLDELTRAILAVGFTTLPQVDERTGLLVWGVGRTAALRRLRDRGAEAPKGVRDAGDDWEIEVRRGWSSRDDAHAAAVREGENRVGEGGYDDRVLYDVLLEVAEDNPAYLGGTGWGASHLDTLADRFGGEDAEPAFGAAAGLPTAPWDDPLEVDPWPDRPRPPEGAGTGYVVEPLGPSFRPVGARPPAPAPASPPVREDPPPAQHRSLPRDEDGPGPAGKTPPRWRLLQPYAAAFHRGGEQGGHELASWLREHGHDAGVSEDPHEDHAVRIVHADRDTIRIDARRWVTLDGETGEPEAWAEEDFLGRFAPANEPARRAQVAAKSSPPDPGGAGPRGEP